MNGPVRLIHFGDRALEIVLPSGTAAETLRLHARAIGAATAAIIRAARDVANDPSEDGPSNVRAMLLGAAFMLGTAALLHDEADRRGGLS